MKDDNVLPLKHGEPMIFGKESDKGIRLNGLRLEVVSLSDTSVEELLKHDESSQELAHTLALMIDRPGMPTPIGVIYREERSTYDDLANGQVETAIERFGEGDLEKLLHEGETWVVA